MLNFDLNPETEEGQTFSLVYLLQNGLDNSSTSTMKIDGFLQLPLNDSWIYWGLSADYLTGTMNLAIKTYDSKGSSFFNKSFTINYTEFQVRNPSELILASVENNPYFQSTSGFIGFIGYIQMANYPVDNLNDIYLGFISNQSLKYNGVIMDLNFNVFTEKSQIQSKGLIQRTFILDTNYIPIFNLQPELSGIQIFTDSKLIFNEVDF